MYCQGQEPQEQHHTHAKYQALSETCEEMADRGRGRNKGRGRNNRGDDGRDHWQDGNQVSNIGAPPPHQFYGFGHPPHTHMDVQWCLWRSVPAHTHTHTQPWAGMQQAWFGVPPPQNFQGGSGVQEQSQAGQGYQPDSHIGAGSGKQQGKVTARIRLKPLQSRVGLGLLDSCLLQKSPASVVENQATIWRAVISQRPALFARQ